MLPPLTGSLSEAVGGTVSAVEVTEKEPITAFSGLKFPARSLIEPPKKITVTSPAVSATLNPEGNE